MAISLTAAILITVCVQTCRAFPHLVEPLDDVNVTAGSQATFLCIVGGITQETIKWYIRVEQKHKFCEINTSPTRIVTELDSSCDDDVFRRFVGVLIEYIDTVDSEHEYWLKIPVANLSDSEFDFTCLASSVLPNGESSRTVLSDWVNLIVRPPMFMTTFTTEITKVTEIVSNKSGQGFNDNGQEGNTVVGVGIGGGLLLTIIVVVIAVVIYKRRCYKRINSRVTKENKTANGNIIGPSELASKSEGVVNNGFLYAQPEVDKSFSKYKSYVPEENPVSNKHKSTPTEAPTYALTNKKKSAAPNVPMKPDTQSSDEIPTYALPNKKKTVKSEDDAETYGNQNVIHNRQGLVQNVNYEDDGSIYYSQVPINIDKEPSGMEETDLAYSIVNLKKDEDGTQSRNIEGLNYADVNHSGASSTFTNNAPIEDTSLAYSEVNF